MPDTLKCLNLGLIRTSRYSALRLQEKTTKLPKELEFLEEKDFIIIPANNAACLYPCYISDIINTDAGWGTFTVTAPFRRRAYGIEGSVESRFNSNGMNFDTSAGWAFTTAAGIVTGLNWHGFSFALSKFIKDNFTATSQGTMQLDPLRFTDSSVKFTADNLDPYETTLDGEKPTYIIKVVKTY